MRRTTCAFVTHLSLPFSHLPSCSPLLPFPPPLPSSLLPSPASLLPPFPFAPLTLPLPSLFHLSPSLAHLTSLPTFPPPLFFSRGRMATHLSTGQFATADRRWLMTCFEPMRMSMRRLRCVPPCTRCPIPSSLSSPLLSLRLPSSHLTSSCSPPTLFSPLVALRLHSSHFTSCSSLRLFSALAPLLLPSSTSRCPTRCLFSPLVALRRPSSLSPSHL